MSSIAWDCRRAGGSGTRLWPLSRALGPKQFMDLGGHTLFGDTVDRAAALPGSADPLVVCSCSSAAFYVAAALQQKLAYPELFCCGAGRGNGIPRPRLRRRRSRRCPGGGDPLLLVLPSDHALKHCRMFSPKPWRGPAPAPSPGVSLHSASRRMHRKQGSGISAGVGRCPRAGMLWRALCWKNRISPEPRPCWRHG